MVKIKINLRAHPNLTFFAACQFFSINLIAEDKKNHTFRWGGTVFFLHSLVIL